MTRTKLIVSRMENVLKICLIMLSLSLFSCNKRREIECLECLNFPTSVLIDLNIIDSLELSFVDEIDENETYYYELRYGNIGRIQDRFRIGKVEGVIITSKSKRKILPAEYLYLINLERDEKDLSVYSDSATLIYEDSVCFSGCLSYTFMYSDIKLNSRKFIWNLWVKVAGHTNLIEVCSIDSALVCKYRDYILEHGKFIEDNMY